MAAAYARHDGRLAIGFGASGRPRQDADVDADDAEPGREADLIVRCVRGLEPLVAAEARHALGATVVGARHREVWLRAAWPPADDGSEPALRTADDAFLRAGRVGGIGRTKADLARLGRAAAGVDWAGVARRAGRPAGPFDVVGSALGRRNFSRFDIEDAVGDAVRAQTGWLQLRRDAAQPVAAGASAVTIRVSLEDGEAGLGVRLADRPLHRRAWRRHDVPGSLHPPVAAAMALAAGVGPGDRVLDPCCGAGTVAVEAALVAPAARVVAADLDPAAAAAARANAEAAGVSARVAVAAADAARPPVRPGGADRVLANLPWGKAVRAAGGLAGGPAPFAAALAGVLAPGGRAALLVGTADAQSLASSAADVGLPVVERVALAVAGTWVTLVVLAGPDRAP
jgi:23S rRNA G2445 N2-methylase RlmL